ncbi:MAG: hypothetical protein ABFC84_12730 [Veillonellales bacterium]
MNRFRWCLLILLVILAVSGFIYENNRLRVTGHVEFGNQGMEIILDRKQEVKTVIVKNELDQPLTIVSLGVGSWSKLPVFISWEPDKRYIVELLLADGRREMIAADSPEVSPEKVFFSLQAPYGLNQENSSGMVPADTVFTANLLLTMNDDLPVNAVLDVVLPTELQITEIPDGMRLELQKGEQHLVGQRRLSAKHEHWSVQLQVRSGQPGGRPVIQAFVHLDNGREKWNVAKQSTLQVASIEAIGSKIKILSVKLPVNSSGVVDPKYRTGNLVYVPPGKLALLTGPQSGVRLDDDPFSYTNIQIGNDGDEQILVMVTGKMLDASTGALAPTFLSPPHKNAGLGYSYGLAAIPPHSSSNIVLPLYLNENNVLPGNYILQTEASLFGIERNITAERTTVNLITRNDRPLLVTCIMALTALTGIGWLLWRREKVLAAYSTKELVLISLFGTVTFVVVNLPQTLLWDIAHVVFGPFSFLFTGFFSQTVFYALVVALAVVLPRTGVVTLMLLVRFILNGFIFGHFTPVLLLSYTMLAICLEGALYAAGVTRKAVVNGKGRIALVACACGGVDVVTAYMNFMAYLTLYRLYYAEWYIYAVMFAGFVYTVAGAFAGCRLGNTLKSTAMD